jgi:hypothetical protein
MSWSVWHSTTATLLTRMFRSSAYHIPHVLKLRSSSKCTDNLLVTSTCTYMQTCLGRAST